MRAHPSGSVPPDEAAAYELLERLRWGGPPASCPHCGAAGRCRFLRPRSGPARPTRTGSPSQRRVWKCAACGRQFSVLIGTVLQGTRTELRTWIAVVDARERSGITPTVAELMSEHGLSRDGATQLARRIDCTLGVVGPAGADDLLSALLRLPAGEAARVRQATPPRVRPRPQRGPTADYG